MPRETKPGLLPPLTPLTLAELRLLRRVPYDEPARIRGTAEVKIARELVGRGLLERDPSSDGMTVRATERGTEAARPLTLADAERVVEAVREAAPGDPEMAAGLERALWRRALLEAAGSERAESLAAMALRTTFVEFPR